MERLKSPCVYIGYDSRESDAFAVAAHSMRKNLNGPIPIRGLLLQDLIEEGLYRRPTRTKTNGEGRFDMVDELSIREDFDGRVSTQHAIARFFVPHVHGPGLALFVDGDILLRADISDVFHVAAQNPDKAVWCVKHDYQPEATTKMDGQLQTRYARKNWSSVMLFNCDHSSNKKLTLDLLNSAPGRDLHAFCWLEDDEIGELHPVWNWLCGHSDPMMEPALVHFTAGTPSMPGFENVDFADEWRDLRDDWARRP